MLSVMLAKQLLEQSAYNSMIPLMWQVSDDDQCLTAAESVAVCV